MLEKLFERRLRAKLKRLGREAAEGYAYGASKLLAAMVAPNPSATQIALHHLQDEQDAIGDASAFDKGVRQAMWHADIVLMELDKVRGRVHESVVPGDAPPRPEEKLSGITLLDALGTPKPDSANGR